MIGQRMRLVGGKPIGKTTFCGAGNSHDPGGGISIS